MQDTRLTLPQQRGPRHAGEVLGIASETNDRPRSLYVHIPFCFHKCHYCDFYSIVDSRDRQNAFTHRLARELEALAAHAGPLRTIFVGGGTPTLLRRDLWVTLLDTMRRAFDLGALEEFTVECNPETAEPALFDTLVAGGVDRLSMGAQSFNTAHLKTLERWHDPASVPKAAALARAAGVRRLSVDLIYAIPGQTLDEWDDDLSRALDLGVSHLSCYNLTYEPNTAMTKRLQRGDFTPTNEDLEIAMFERTHQRLSGAGLARYEVSNYAMPGDECRHNLAYWRQEAWLAAGPSASAHVGACRWKNTPRLDDYLNNDEPGFARVVDVEAPDPRRALAERLMTGLRLTEGVDQAEVLAAARSIDERLGDRLLAAARAIEARGQLSMSDRWTITDQGVLLADGLAGELMAIVQET